MQKLCNSFAVERKFFLQNSVYLFLRLFRFRAFFPTFPRRIRILLRTGFISSTVKDRCFTPQNPARPLEKRAIPPEISRLRRCLRLHAFGKRRAFAFCNASPLSTAFSRFFRKNYCQQMHIQPDSGPKMLFSRAARSDRPSARPPRCGARRRRGGSGSRGFRCHPSAQGTPRARRRFPPGTPR